MKKNETYPRFNNLRSGSSAATRAASASSKKADTKPELRLRKALWRRGWRFRKNVKYLPGKPDIVFTRQRFAIFVDGDFWHGRDLKVLVKKLSRGHNGLYWVAKIRRNVERDKESTRQLEESGWKVVRCWESDIHKNTDDVISVIEARLKDADA